MNSWHEMKTYLRDKKIGDEVTKHDMVYYNVEDPYMLVIDTTVDKYVNDLIRAGVLERVNFDTYKIIRRLTKKAKITVLRKMVNGDWRSWFMNDLFESE